MTKVSVFFGITILALCSVCLAQSKDEEKLDARSPEEIAQKAKKRVEKIALKLNLKDAQKKRLYGLIAKMRDAGDAEPRNPDVDEKQEGIIQQLSSVLGPGQIQKIKADKAREIADLRQRKKAAKNQLRTAQAEEQKDRRQRMQRLNAVSAEERKRLQDDDLQAADNDKKKPNQQKEGKKS